MSEEGATRDEVVALVRRFPGIHMRSIVRLMDTSTALAQYHLTALVDAGALRAMTVGGFVRYFPAEEYRELTDQEREIVAILRQEKPLEIVLTLLELGPMTHSAIAEALGSSKAGTSYHLRKLVGSGIVRKVPRGPDRGFHLIDPDGLRDLLARYEPAPDLLDVVHDTWEDLFGGG